MRYGEPVTGSAVSRPGVAAMSKPAPARPQVRAHSSERPMRGRITPVTPLVKPVRRFTGMPST